MRHLCCIGTLAAFFINGTCCVIQAALDVLPLHLCLIAICVALGRKLARVLAACLDVLHLCHHATFMRGVDLMGRLLNKKSSVVAIRVALALLQLLSHRCHF